MTKHLSLNGIGRQIRGTVVGSAFLVSIAFPTIRERSSLSPITPKVSFQLKTQNNVAPKSARVGRAARERALIVSVPRPTRQYFLKFIAYHGPKNEFICSRAWGARGTPDIPWTLGTGYTWTDCLDKIKGFWASADEEYLQWSILEDFMQSTSP
jgi:hypothetical protein